MWNKIVSLFNPKADQQGSDDEEEVTNACCDQPEVHIAYRGKSDDHLYMARNRTWREVKYFQPNGLRVFCAKCRRRVY